MKAGGPWRLHGLWRIQVTSTAHNDTWQGQSYCADPDCGAENSDRCFVRNTDSVHLVCSRGSDHSSNPQLTGFPFCLLVVTSVEKPEGAVAVMAGSV